MRLILGILGPMMLLPAFTGPEQTNAQLTPDDLVRITQLAPRTTARGARVPVDIALHSESAKVVTAYTLSLVARYADDEEAATEVSFEALGNILSQGSEGQFSRGADRRVTTFVPCDREGLPPTLVAGRVTMLVFADRTSIGDSQAIRAVLDRRVKESQYWAGLIGELLSIKAKPGIAEGVTRNEARALLQAREAITDRIARLDKREPDYQRRVYDLNAAAAKLQGGGLPFEALLEEYSTMQRTYALHSSLREEQ